MRGDDVEARSALLVPRNGGEGRCKRRSRKLGDRVAEQDAQIALLGKLGECLGDEHEAFGAQAKPGQQRLVEHEHSGQVRPCSKRRIAVAERLRREPYRFGLAVDDGFVRARKVGARTQ